MAVPTGLTAVYRHGILTFAVKEEENSREPAFLQGFWLFHYYGKLLWNLSLFDVSQNFFHLSKWHTFLAKIYIQFFADIGKYVIMVIE